MEPVAPGSRHATAIRLIRSRQFGGRESCSPDAGQGNKRGSSRHSNNTTICARRHPVDSNQSLLCRGVLANTLHNDRLLSCRRLRSLSLAVQPRHGKSQVLVWGFSSSQDIPSLRAPALCHYIQGRSVCGRIPRPADKNRRWWFLWSHTLIQAFSVPSRRSNVMTIFFCGILRSAEWVDRKPAAIWTQGFKTAGSLVCLLRAPTAQQILQAQAAASAWPAARAHQNQPLSRLPREARFRSAEIRTGIEATCMLVGFHNAHLNTHLRVLFPRPLHPDTTLPRNSTLSCLAGPGVPWQGLVSHLIQSPSKNASGLHKKPTCSDLKPTSCALQSRRLWPNASGYILGPRKRRTDEAHMRFCSSRNDWHWKV